MNISIERAITTDAETLVSVQIAAFHHDAQIYPGVEIGGPSGYDSVDQMLQKIQNDDCYKILADGQCIGGVVVFDMGRGHYHLDVIFVDPAYHRHGVGTQAMQYVEKMYSASRWTLDTPRWAVRNHGFYEKLGYVKEHEFEHDGTPLIAYVKHVAHGAQNPGS